ncbi:MAG: hypothetical protein ACR2GI_04140, partial [Thermomicrobiales bacterium]
LTAERNLTIVLVSHDAGVGEQCDRIVRMQDGSIVGEDFPSGAPPEIKHTLLEERREQAPVSA